MMFSIMRSPHFCSGKTYEVIPVVIGVPVREGQQPKVIHVLLPQQRGKELIVDYVLIFGIENAASLLLGVKANRCKILS